MNTDIAIVGAGPSGMMLAIELGRRGVACVLLEESPTTKQFPKANATSARTMEHYRRCGFADQVRASGLPDDRAQDVVYATRGNGHEMARFCIPSPAQARSGNHFGDYGEAEWPTPELPHRGQQMVIEPILLTQARKHASVDVRMGCKVTAVADLGTHVQIDALQQGGQPLQLQARYVVGCDGARSVVREAMGVGYAGRGREERDFFGGQMLTIHFRSTALASVLALRPAWTYWIVNPERRGVLVAMDGRDTWVAGIQLKPGQDAATVDIAATLASLVGQPIPFELIASGTWLAGFMLVADAYRRGRCLIAGDAAHLFTPAGGMGYNTAVDDAVNLGWKLAAVCQGWGGEALLDSYEAERRPIALRNTAFARRMADSMGQLSSPAELELPGPLGDAARLALGAKCLAHIHAEFNIPGLQLGLRYQSAVVAQEDGPPPPDEPNHYQPSGYPGVRAPHLPDPSAGPNGSLLDRFGTGFTLLCLAGPLDLAPWRDAAAALALPLQTVPSDDPAARALYGAELVLIRPDHHIAWRGAASADAMGALRTAVALPA